MKIKDFEVETYDLFGYFLPGFLLMIEIYLLFSGYKSLLPSIQKLTLVEAIFLLILSYILGHVVQSLATLIDKIFEKNEVTKKFCTMTTYNFLLDKDVNYSEKFKKYLWNNICKKFNCEKFDLNSNKERKEISELCFTYVLNNNDKTKLPIFSSICGFYRGMSYSSFLGFIIFLIASVSTKNLIFLFLYFICFVLWVIFVIRYKKFHKHLEDNIYKDFLICNGNYPVII